MQGVRPISLALERGWPIRAVLYDADRPLSRWGAQVIDLAAARTENAGEILSKERACACVAGRWGGGVTNDIPEKNLLLYRLSNPN